ncbi:MAG: hypothetical protein KDA70_17485, partial [Planctomycetaceae bacterium]|nr:hypothetical protein [Planctomycetaceae bacterium]
KSSKQPHFLTVSLLVLSFISPIIEHNRSLTPTAHESTFSQERSAQNSGKLSKLPWFPGCSMVQALNSKRFAGTPG